MNIFDIYFVVGEGNVANCECSSDEAGAGRAGAGRAGAGEPRSAQHHGGQARQSPRSRIVECRGNNFFKTHLRLNLL